MSKWCRALVFVPLAIGSSFVHAEPCFGPAFGVVVPADGTRGVPVNATVIVSDDGVSELRVEDEAGADVPAELIRITLDGGQFEDSGLRVLRFNEDLAPNATFRVFQGDRLESEFVTGTLRDDAPPARPGTSFGGSFDSCGANAINVTVDPDGALVTAAADVDPSFVDGATWSGARPSSPFSNPPLLLNGALGAVQHVVAVDLAGNASDVSLVEIPIELSAEPRGVACSSTSNAPAPVLALALALAAGARQSRRSRST